METQIFAWALPTVPRTMLFIQEVISFRNLFLSAVISRFRQTALEHSPRLSSSQSAEEQRKYCSLT